MSNRRYHIHVICTAHDQPLILDSLAVFFQKTAFLTYDVANQLPQASLYNRQNIESCDYTVVVIGDNYGASAGVFVSQMHLSYLSAKSKLKPMLTLIKNHDDSAQLSWQLLDFIRLVERQSNHVYYYNDSTDVEQLLSYADKELLEKGDITAKWIRQSNPSAVTEANKDKVRASLNYSIKNDEQSYADASINSSSQDNRYREQPRVKSNPTTDIINTADTSHRIVSTEKNTDTDTLTTVISLTETIDIMYSAQAYEAGNLSDVAMSTTLTWQQILTALATIPSPFSNYGLQNCLTRLIADNVEIEIKAQMPNVHAVSRCKISERDLAILQRLLVAANWIQIVASATRTTQELWNLTYYAKQLYDQQS